MEKSHDYPTATEIAASLIKMLYVADENQIDIDDEDIPPTGFVEIPDDIAQKYEKEILTALVL